MGKRTTGTLTRKQGTALAVAALALALGVGVWRWIANRDAPEVVIDELPPKSEVRVRDGIVYLFERNAPDQTSYALTRITARAVGSDRPPRSLSVPDIRSPFFSRDALQFGKDALLSVEEFQIIAQPAVFSAGGGGSAAGGISPRVSGTEKGALLGEFRLSAPLSKPAPGEERRSFPAGNGMEKGGAYLWSIPLDGGKARKIRLDTRGKFPFINDFAPEGGGFFWRYSHPVTAYEISRKEGYYNAFPPSAELLWSPIDGGPPQTVATGLCQNEAFKVNTQVVAWERRNAYPDKSVGLYLKRFAEGVNGKTYFLPDFVGSDIPIQFSGRWYWTEPETPGPEETAPNPDDTPFGPGGRSRVVSDALNGGDRRTLVTGRDAAGVNRLCERLIVSGDRLYVLISAAGRKVGMPSRILIARVRPERVEALGTPRPLPEGTNIKTAIADGGFLYITATRNEKDWRQLALDAFSEKAIEGGKNVRRLYRVLLPE